jgi:hypothetical protein
MATYLLSLELPGGNGLTLDISSNARSQKHGFQLLCQSISSGTQQKET